MPIQIELIGKKFNKLLVLEKASERSTDGSIQWLCQCDCGRKVLVRTVNLNKGIRQSCGCAPRGREKSNLEGQRFHKLTVINRVTGTKKSYWNCKCDCGKEKIVSQCNLISKRIKSCGCLRLAPAIDLTGKRVGELIILSKSDIKYKSPSGWTAPLWKCHCDCGKEVFLTTYAITSGKKSSCPTCEQKRREEDKKTKYVFGGTQAGKSGRGHRKYHFNTDGIGEIPTQHVCRIIRGAKDRNIIFEATAAQLWQQFLKQQGKCALSGLPINFNREKLKRYAPTASLDRIDSDKGYVSDNIQWVHKDLNNMKQYYSQTDFINYCKLVAQNFSQKEQYEQNNS
jgi:hypothetical protein